MTYIVSGGALNSTHSLTHHDINAGTMLLRATFDEGGQGSLDPPLFHQQRDFNQAVLSNLSLLIIMPVTLLLKNPKSVLIFDFRLCDCEFFVGVLVARKNGTNAWLILQLCDFTILNLLRPIQLLQGGRCKQSGLRAPSS